MTRSLLTAAAFLALTSPAFALDVGGERLSGEMNISPMTAAIVQSAQARAMAGPAQRAPATNDNPALGTAAAVNGGTSPLLQNSASAGLRKQLLQGSAELQARPSANQRKAAQGGGGGGGDPGFADPAQTTSVVNVTPDGVQVTSSGLQTGGVPVIINDNRQIDRRTGNFTDVTNNQTINGNNNAATATVSDVANGQSVTTVKPPRRAAPSSATPR